MKHNSLRAVVILNDTNLTKSEQDSVKYIELRGRHPMVTDVV